VRILRVIVTSLAVLAGLVGAAVVMTIGVLVYSLLRMFGRPARRPRFQPGPARARPAYATKDEVIDVTATDVKE
jgi:hypothetical protein